MVKSLEESTIARGVGSFIIGSLAGLGGDAEEARGALERILTKGVIRRRRELDNGGCGLGRGVVS